MGKLLCDEKTTTVNAPKDVLLKAIDLAIQHEWEAAHLIVQQYEDDSAASWIHAVLHKIEGDVANSRYWYRRANKLERVNDVPRSELMAIRAEITGS